MITLACGRQNSDRTAGPLTRLPSIRWTTVVTSSAKQYRELAPSGYFFGVDQGLSLSGSGAFNVYSIDIHFYFDNVSASINGYQKIIDFKNRTSDSGLYS